MSAGFFTRHQVMQYLDQAEQLRDHLRNARAAQTCQCTLGCSSSWTSFTEERWPISQMKEVATLRDPEVHEPTFEEKHPQGTRYDSSDAPVAMRYFPYNRCDLWLCQRCQQHVLRYTEFGGYYVDHRVRAIGTGAQILD